MTIHSQLYLLQLEDYDLNRFKNWVKNNPGREVVEKKGKLKWTFKAKSLYFLARVTGSIIIACKIYQPVDFIIKNLLIFLAKLKLTLHHNLVVIGITGSWGKTTTKEQLAVVLQQKFKVFKTVGNHNTILGIALDILKMPLDTEIFVCEMGAYKKGEIKQICNLVNPKIGIITTIGPMHLERFGSLEAIKQTKMELFDSAKIKIGPDANWQKPICDYFKVEQIKNFPEIEHRQQIMKNNGITIIDDSYNSNPVGFQVALKKMKGKPKILVTPGMVELGQMQFEENKKVAQKAAKICDYVIFVGTTNKEAWKTGCPKAIFVSDIEEAKTELSKYSKPGAVILFENDLPDHYF